MAHRDPTANRAIAAADRRPVRRKIVQEYPEVFEGLTDHQVRDVALLAHSMAGDNVWAIRGTHLRQARARIVGPDGDSEANTW